MQKNGQTVRVLDEQGTEIGYTYPKRAKGLVKKCRAEFVSDHEIRLYKQSPTYEDMEDDRMDTMNTENKTYFVTVNPKDWRKNPAVADTVCDRFFITNPFAGEIPGVGSMAEVLSVGTYEWNHKSYITNGCQELEAHTEYHLVFWLNGGENDRSDEICQLQILFTGNSVTASVEEFENGMCYRLNRGYIKPLKKYKGWEYYDIPFVTTDERYTQFQFVADRAPMALLPAEEPSAYEDLEDVLDAFEGKRPQRHNIVFDDGWPTNKWYSTDNLAHRGRLPEGVDHFDTDEYMNGFDVDDMREQILKSMGMSIRNNM